MSRYALALAFFVAGTGTALACGDGKCNMEKCNMPATNTAQALPADGSKVKLAVAGMSCGACADKVAASLKAVDGVKGATVSADTGVAEVSYDAGKTNPEKLVAAVNAGGHFTASLPKN